jgi:uncharacterized membrane protein YccC
MSTTPRTDEQVLDWTTEDGSDIVFASMARELETELAAAKKRIADCEFVMAHRYDIIERQEPRCNEANARAEKAEADTARLDWLQNNKGQVGWTSGREPNLPVASTPSSFGVIGATVRAAIDAAMKEASK